ncbi:S8 family serine peptidase [Actinoplanes sp. NPDC048796]|uniref:S8 family serine peptidase n=1 Tax=Actinoplanes sp. NPDC048796 TaxID=3155640 RepID=UPI0033FD237E
MRRSLVRTLLLALAAVLVTVGAAPAPAAADEPNSTKYYIVRTSYQGKPETLYEIAAQFLGDERRFVEILRLNAGRKQPGGGVLSDALGLRQGWVLLLPWDAAGDGVEHGVPPPVSSTAPQVVKRDCTAPAALPRPNPTAPTAGVSGGRPRTNGAGQVVAVIDNACLGTDTGMAKVIAGRKTSNVKTGGIAPDATIRLIRMTSTGSTTTAASQVTALKEATAAGATVVALGPTVNPAQPGFKEAVAEAVRKGAVVVVGAGATRQLGLLRVARAGLGAKTDAGRAKEESDVIAPDAGGAGHVAVAYAAGVAALVRAAYPNLTAEQICDRIMATADLVGDGSPPGRGHVWGMINLSAAVAQDPPADQRPRLPSTSRHDEPALVNAGALLLFGVFVLTLGVAILLARRLRRVWRSAHDPFDGPETTALPPIAVAVGGGGGNSHWTDSGSDSLPAGPPPQYADRPRSWIDSAGR